MCTAAAVFAVDFHNDRQGGAQAQKHQLKVKDAQKTDICKVVFSSPPTLLGRNIVFFLRAGLPEFLLVKLLHLLIELVAVAHFGKILMGNVGENANINVGTQGF